MSLNKIFKSSDGQEIHYKTNSGQVVMTSGTTVEQEISTIKESVLSNRPIVINDDVPVGTIVFTSSSSILNGWLRCEGQSVSSAEYPELYQAIGTKFGGDSTNFKIPNIPLENLIVDSINSGNTEINSISVSSQIAIIKAKQVAKDMESVAQEWTSLKENGGQLGGFLTIENQLDILHETGNAMTVLAPFKNHETMGQYGLTLGTTWDGNTPFQVALSGVPGLWSALSPMTEGMDLGGATAPWQDLYLGNAKRDYNGYTSLPNGMMLQWGEQYATVTDPDLWSLNISLNFPIAFPTTCRQVVPSLQLRYTDGDWATLGASLFQTDLKANGFSAKISLTGNGNKRQRDYRLIWIAIGY